MHSLQAMNLSRRELSERGMNGDQDGMYTLHSNRKWKREIAARYERLNRTNRHMRRATLRTLTHASAT